MEERREKKKFFPVLLLLRLKKLCVHIHYVAILCLQWWEQVLTSWMISNESESMSSHWMNESKEEFFDYFLLESRKVEWEIRKLSGGRCTQKT
jgi:hypothetical protein